MVLTMPTLQFQPPEKTTGTGLPALESRNPAVKYRILIVDDEVPNRSLLSAVLTSAGFYCEEAGDGVLALTALAARPFDLVILDIDMPNMKGTEVLRRLRELPPCPHLKIIMISGRVSADELAQMMLGGADDYLVKPFSSTELKARVQTALHMKEAQDRSARLNCYLLGANRKLEQNLHVRDSDLMKCARPWCSPLPTWSPIAITRRATI